MSVAPRAWRTFADGCGPVRCENNGGATVRNVGLGPGLCVGLGPQELWAWGPRCWLLLVVFLDKANWAMTIPRVAILWDGFTINV